MNASQLVIVGTATSLGTSVPQSVSGRQCPVCTSWATTRHVEGFRVWFTCDRCGAVFG